VVPSASYPSLSPERRTRLRIPAYKLARQFRAGKQGKRGDHISDVLRFHQLAGGIEVFEELYVGLGEGFRGAKKTLHLIARKLVDSTMMEWTYIRINSARARCNGRYVLFLGGECSEDAHVSGNTEGRQCIYLANEFIAALLAE
jgi:hypothetical protein